MASEIVLYRAFASRAFPVLWLLEELGLAYRSEIVSLAARPANQRASQLNWPPDKFSAT